MRRTLRQLVARLTGRRDGARATGHYRLICRDPAGHMAWSDEIANMVVHQGLDYLLSVALAGGTPITAWYLGLTAASPTPAAGDTLASHAGWTELTSYSQAGRPAWTPGAVSGQAVSNAAAQAQYTLSGTGTVGGAFLASSATKGGATGTLYSVGALTGGNKPFADGYTLELTATFSQADDDA